MTRTLCMILLALCLSACWAGGAPSDPAPPQPSDPTHGISGPSASQPQLSEPDTSGPAPGLSGASPQTTEQAPDPSIADQLASERQASQSPSDQQAPVLKITVAGVEFSATFEENSSAEAFQELLAQGPLTIEMEDYGGFEKVGPLGTQLPRNDAQITTQPGDVILYQGDQITIYSGTNTWSFTRLARIDDPTDLEETLAGDTATVTFSIG